jgi:hypothetical protein
MYTFKNISIEAKLFNPKVVDFSRTIIDMVETFEHSFMIGLADIRNIRRFGTCMSKITSIHFFTQLLGIAFSEQPEKLRFGLEFNSTRLAKVKIRVETPEFAVESAQATKPRKPTGLPLLPMLTNQVSTKQMLWIKC